MDALKFEPQTNIATSSTVTSNTVTIAGLSGPSVVTVESIVGTADGAGNTSTTPIANATSNTSPYVLTGPQYSTGAALWKMFDGSTSAAWFSALGTDPNILIEFTIDLVSPKLINKYRLFGSNQAVWALVDWKFFGSSDGTSWELLDDVQYGSSVGAAYTPYRTFEGRSYRYYKFSTDNHGASGVAIGELQLIESSQEVGPTLVSTLTVNGSSAGQSSSVSNGDTLSVTCDTPAIEDFTTFIPVVYSGYKTSVFAFRTTAGDSAQGMFPAYEDKLPFEYDESYTPSAPNNKLSIVNVAGDSISSVPFVDVASPAPATINDGKDYVFAADYFGNKVQRIDIESGAVVQTININAPFGVGYTPSESPSTTNITHTLISSPDNNLVHVYDGAQHSELYQVSVGNKPVAVVGAPTTVLGDYAFYVSCHDDDTVEYYEKVGAAAPALVKTYAMPASSGPSFLLLDDNGDCWVSLLNTNQVAKCIATSTAVNTVSVSSDPWDMGKSATFIYVACPAENKVTAIEIATNSTTDIEVGVDPSHVEILGTDLWTLSFNSGVITKYPMVSSTEIGAGVEYSSTRMGSGLTGSLDETKMYSLNLNEDAPLRFGPLERDPSAFTVTDQPNVSVNIEVVSEENTVSGLGTTGRITVPSLYDLVIIKNGLDSGTSVSIENGDTISFKLTSDSSSGIAYSIPIMFDDTFLVWEVSTETGTAVNRLHGWMGGG